MKKIVGLALMFAACAFAQGPGGPLWWDNSVVRDMNLNESQRKQIQATVREYRDQLIQQRADLQIAEGNLRDLMNEDQVNEAKATEAIDKVVAARGAMARTLSMMSLKMRQVLTAEQWRELQRRRPQSHLAPNRPFGRQGRPFDRRPGPPGQPGPGRPPEPPAPPAPPQP